MRAPSRPDLPAVAATDVHLPALPGDDRLGAWCGWVLVAVLALAPVLAWLGCLGFAPLAALAGLLTVPALRWPTEKAVSVPSLVLLVGWACASAIWSPFVPPHLSASEAPKLVVLLLTGISLVTAVPRSSLRTSRGAETVLIYGMLALASLLFYEGLTEASLYRGLRAALGTVLRPDLAAKNVAQALYVLILLGPAAVLAAYRRTEKLWTAWIMAAGLVLPSLSWGYDAPLLALAVAGLSGWATYRFPRAAPTALAALTGLFFLGAPWTIWGLLRVGVYDTLLARVEPSWAERMGYWRVAATATLAHPFRGWGLDASRTFSPGIHLHPHDSALQIWLELGLPGALLAALCFGSVFYRLQRSRGDLDAAVAVATVAAYLTIGEVSSRVWQEWWIGLGIVAAAACLLVSQRRPCMF